jgi:hypothetical protein
VNGLAAGDRAAALVGQRPAGAERGGAGSEAADLETLEGRGRYPGAQLALGRPVIALGGSIFAGPVSGGAAMDVGGAASISVGTAATVTYP